MIQVRQHSVWTWITLCACLELNTRLLWGNEAVAVSIQNLSVTETPNYHLLPLGRRLLRRDKILVRGCCKWPGRSQININLPQRNPSWKGTAKYRTVEFPTTKALFRMLSARSSTSLGSIQDITFHVSHDINCYHIIYYHWKYARCAMNIVQSLRRFQGTSILEDSIWIYCYGLMILGIPKPILEVSVWACGYE